MESYAYIKTLFQGILDGSLAIQGRFHISHRYGAQEINSDSFGELIADIVGPKYPLCAMVAPHSRVTYSIDEWERYRVILYFVDTSYYGPNADTSPKTKTARTPIVKDWDRMKLVADNFIRKLKQTERAARPSLFRLPKNQALYIPVSTIGADRVSGVRLDFDLDIFIGCEILEDYVADIIPTPVVIITE